MDARVGGGGDADIAPRAVELAPDDGGPWRLTMGLRRLDPSAWLEVDDDREEDLSLKASLLKRVHGEVLATLDGCERASTELLQLVLTSLADIRPGLVAVDGRTVTERTTGSVVDLDAVHPIEAASRIVQEDLCVMELDDAAREWRLTAACVCFPSRWRLRDKLGQSIAGIHAPVPGFDEALAAPSARFFDRLTVERPAWRANWTIIDSPTLHQPDRPRAVAPDAVDAGVGAAMWLRVERQTLRRLVVSDAVVFTIRTYVARLDELVAARPATAVALCETLRTVPVEVAAYKGWTQVLGSLVAWLEQAG